MSPFVSLLSAIAQGPDPTAFDTIAGRVWSNSHHGVCAKNFLVCWLRVQVDLTNVTCDEHGASLKCIVVTLFSTHDGRLLLFVPWSCLYRVYRP